ncbi:hypothetical protein IQ238_18505 [Pleurocapsales cyanobacterium LEGE 06147]|nr:hypothetical protein [Pleurocapsales cyanobacterium LEGE 06147]
MLHYPITKLAVTELALSAGSQRPATDSDLLIPKYHIHRLYLCFRFPSGCLYQFGRFKSLIRAAYLLRHGA